MKKFIIVNSFLILLGKDIHAAEAGMPQLDPQYWASQVFWLVIIFLSIYVLIDKIFIPKIRNNIDVRKDKISKDLESAKNFKEQAEKKLEEYNLLIESAKKDANKILSESRQKLNEDMQIKRAKIQKEIDEELNKAEKEIKKFKNDSSSKINIISEDIASNLLKDIFGEELNKSSIKASVSQSIKDYESKNQ